MRLYFNRFSRAARIRWLIEELGVPCEIVTVDLRAGEQFTAAYKAIHPLGKVPAFVDDDGTVMIESAAILLHLGDKFPGFAPAVPHRAEYYTWLVYGQVTLEPPVVAYFDAKVAPPEHKRDAVLGDKATLDFRTVVAPIEARLATRPFILGDTLSTPDFVIGATLVWANRMGMCEGFPHAQGYASRIAARPAFEKSRA